MNIKKLVQEAHDTAKDKDWWESSRSPLEIAALIHSEVSEFVEDCRKPSWPCHVESGWRIQNKGNPPNHKPVGPLIELADVVIRVADYCGYRGWDLERAIEIKLTYNKKRKKRHGNKRY